MSVELFRVVRLPSDIGIRLGTKHDISLTSVLRFITMVVDQEPMNEFIESIYFRHMQCIRFLEYRIRDAIHMIYPLYCYISATAAAANAATANAATANAATANAANAATSAPSESADNCKESKQFDELLPIVDCVYEPSYTSLSQALTIVHDVALYCYIIVNELDVCSVDTERLLAKPVNHYRIFRQIVDTFISQSNPARINIILHRTAGLYDALTDEHLVPAAIPTGSIMFLDSRFTIMYNLYGVFKRSNDIQESTPSHDMMAIRGALSSTVCWRDGRVVERCRDAETLLRVAPDRDGLPCNVLDKCPFCLTFDAKVYSPVCNHIVGCTMCTRNVSKKLCHACGAQLSKVKVFLLLPTLGGVRDDDLADAKHLCDRLVPGVGLCDSVYKNIATTYLDLDSVNKVARYLARVTGKREEVIVNRANIYFATNCTLRRDGDDAAWWYVSMTVKMPNYSIRIGDEIHEAVPTELRYLRTSALIEDDMDDDGGDDEDEDVDSDIDELLEYATYNLENVAYEDAARVGRAIFVPINEYIKEHPEHTINEVLSLVKIDKVFNTTDSCVVCMDSSDLVILSKCQHQVSCLECTVKNDNCCPVCRSTENAILRLAQSPKRGPTSPLQGCKPSIAPTSPSNAETTPGNAETTPSNA